MEWYLHMFDAIPFATSRPFSPPQPPVVHSDNYQARQSMYEYMSIIISTHFPFGFSHFKVHIVPLFYFF